MAAYFSVYVDKWTIKQSFYIDVHVFLSGDLKFIETLIISGSFPPSPSSEKLTFFHLKYSLQTIFRSLWLFSFQNAFGMCLDCGSNWRTYTSFKSENLIFIKYVSLGLLFRLFNISWHSIKFDDAGFLNLGASIPSSVDSSASSILRSWVRILITQSVLFLLHLSLNWETDENKQK